MLGRRHSVCCDNGGVTKQEAIARLAELRATRTRLNDAYQRLISEDVTDYSLSTFAGESQRAKRRTLKDVRVEIEAVNQEIEALEKRCASMGVVSIEFDRWRTA